MSEMEVKDDQLLTNCKVQLTDDGRFHDVRVIPG
jgi:hypothetical protein